MNWPFLSFALLVPTIADGSDGRASYSFRLQEVRPGCSDDGVGYPVTIVVRVALTNRSGRPLIVSREFSTAPYYRLAASAEKGVRGEYEANGGDLEVQAAKVPEPEFGPAPDEDRSWWCRPVAATKPTHGRASSLATGGRLTNWRQARLLGSCYPVIT